MAQTSRTCIGCGVTIYRTKPAGAIPKRCGPCLRRYRADCVKAAYVPVEQYRTCVDCGIEYRAPGRDTKSLRCPPCRKAHKAAWSKAWAEANPEKAHRSKRAWHEANRAYVKSAKHARRVVARADSAERFTSHEIFVRDNWTCQICGIHLDPDIKFPDNRSASIDHIVPIKAGGAHTKANVQAACMGCNRRKGGRMAH